MTYSLRRLLLAMVVVGLTLGVGLQWAGRSGALSSIVAAMALGGIVLRWRYDAWMDAAGAAVFTLVGAALMGWGMFPGFQRGIALDFAVGSAVAGAGLGAFFGGFAYLFVSAFFRFTMGPPRRPPES